MARNITEAIAMIAKEQGISPQEIIDNEIVMEIEAEIGEEFEVWKHTDGHIAVQGEPIGYVVIDGTSEVFTNYEQYTAEEWTL